MAIGLGRMFGFEFLENFNYPYISASITEFWRRWHISLSTWFRDYVYIPLGGNRVNLPRQVFNLLVVWILTGFWHGASWNFLLWGLYYGILLIVEKFLLGSILDKIPKPIRHTVTLLLVLIGWVLFKADTVPEALSYLKTMFSFDFSGISGRQLVRYLSNYGAYWVVAAIACTPLVSLLNRRLKKCITAKNSLSVAYSICEKAVYLALFALTAAYLTSASYNAFIYFRF
jgi:alginate O-acetyltransferase complex protein AlgI